MLKPNMLCKPSPHRQLHLLESPPRMIFDVETEEGLQEILGIFVGFFCCWLVLREIPALKGIPSKELTYPTREKENHLQKCLFGGYEIC